MNAPRTVTANFERPHLTSTQVGMLAFLASEVAFFSTLIVAYLAFFGKDLDGPRPSVLSIPLAALGTLCLVSSSVTIHFAERSLRRDQVSTFQGWWSLTIALGISFLAITFYEWHGLIYEQGLTISRNLFGTTYYTLVGFHALHVTCGVVSMLIIAVLGMRVHPPAAGVELVSWYWHFVDVVWIVVFCVVYLASRSAT